MNVNGRLALAAVLIAALSGCSTLERMGVINARDGANEVGSTSRGTSRLSLVPLEDQLLVSGALQGVGFFLPPPAAIGEWPLPGGTPEQSVEHVAAAPQFRVAWTRDIGRGTSAQRFITAPPVSANGFIYVMDAGAIVSALDAQSGREVWSVNLAPNRESRFEMPQLDIPFLNRNRLYPDTDGFGGGLAVSGGRIFVTSGYRFVAALDARTGAEIWRTDSASPIHSAPTVSGGRVFAVSTDNELVTFDAGTGQVGWEYHALVEPVRILKASSPAVSGETIITGFASGELSALRTVNGNELWSHNLVRVTRTTALSEIRDIAGRPVIYRGDVYAGSHSGAFAAVDIRTGQPRWQIPLVTMATPLPVGDVVYGVSKYGQVVCISRTSGLIYWITALNNESQAQAPDRWFEFWRGLARDPTATYWTGPILASGRLITVSSAGFAAALNPNTGEILEYIDLGGPALMEPIAVGGYVYVVTDNGKLVAIG